MKLFFKKCIFLLSLLAVFVSMLQPDTYDFMLDNTSSPQISMVQIDKDNLRDAADAVWPHVDIAKLFIDILPKDNFHDLNYQEPILNNHPKPPIA